MISRLLPAALLLVCVSCRAAELYPVFNVRVGTQTFDPKYQFTTQTMLVETARRIHEMGSDIIKFTLARDEDIAARKISRAEIARSDPSVRYVLDMPFRYYLLWAYAARPPNGTHNWRNGFSPEEEQWEYSQMYDLARYLLRTYNGSRKTFLLGHWEGDWTLLSSFDASKDPSETATLGMISWLRTRQRAVDDAKRDEPHEDVDVMHYTEVNLVAKAVEGKRSVTNSVLPHVEMDLVSYSSYDGLGKPFPRKLFRCLEHIASKARTKAPFEPDVFIGEYGFALNSGKLSRNQQGARTSDVIKAATGYGCPFVLYWEMYDNESGDERKGFWLIDNQNRKQPSWFVHQAFLGRAHAFKNLYRFWLHRNPDEKAFSDFGRQYDKFRTSRVMNEILDSSEYHRLVSDAAFAERVCSCIRDMREAEALKANVLARLRNRTKRSDALDLVLNSAAHRHSFDNSAFVRHCTQSMMMPPGAVVRDNRGTGYSGLIKQLQSGRQRSSMWREILDSEAFFRAELPIRQIDEKDSPVIAARYFF